LKRLESEMGPNREDRKASRWIRHIEFLPNSQDDCDGTFSFSKAFVLMPCLVKFDNVYLSLTAEEFQALVQSNRSTLRSLRIRVDDDSVGVLPLINQFECLEQLALDIACFQENDRLFPSKQPLTLPTVCSFSASVNYERHATLALDYIGLGRFSQGCLTLQLMLDQKNENAVNFLKAITGAHRCCRLGLGLASNMYAKLGLELVGIHWVTFGYQSPITSLVLPFVDKTLPEVLELHVDSSVGVNGSLWDSLWDFFELVPYYDGEESDADCDSGPKLHFGNTSLNDRTGSERKVLKDTDRGKESGSSHTPWVDIAHPSVAPVANFVSIWNL
jgi:hypothetical protein